MEPQFIMKIIEENIDGCGGNAYAYVTFTKPITDEIHTEFKRLLTQVKQNLNDSDYDTDDMVEMAVQNFNKSPFAQNRYVSVTRSRCPYSFAVSF